MNNSFSLQQRSRTGNLDSNLISRENRLNLLADFMRVKYESPKMKQSEIAIQLGCSTSTLHRYRNNIYVLSPYRIHPHNTNSRTKKSSDTSFDNNSHHDPGVKRPEMTSNDLKTPESTSNENGKKVKTKNNLKAGFFHDNVEIDDQYLDEILDNNGI